MAKHAAVEQPNKRPTAKVTAAGVGAALATAVLTLADLQDVIDLPTFGDAFLTGVAAFIAGYSKKSRATER